MNGYASPFGIYKALFTTWYRAEYIQGNQLTGVNYYDIGMIRVDTDRDMDSPNSTLPYHSYVGVKYDCSKVRRIFLAA